jgi:hypothetical protein
MECNLTTVGQRTHGVPSTFLALDGKEVSVGKVVAMPIRSSLNQGVFFEPEVIALMSEAFEAACKVLHVADEREIVRELIASRIIAAARFGERDPVRLLATALAGHRRKLTTRAAWDNQAFDTR